MGQPFADGRDLRDFLSAVALDESIDQVDVVVAWAKRSGLRRVRPHLEKVRGRPGLTRIIVGIDEGGATRQGLELAREIFSTVHVFHDNSSRTFHPKIYLGMAPDHARLLIGSTNLTAGGVFYNYEAGLECILTLPKDQALLDAVRAYIARLYADKDVCKALDDALLTELLSKPRYRVADEDATKAPSSNVPDEDEPPEDVDVSSGVVEAAQGSIFGRSTEAKRPDPMPSKAAPKKAAAGSKKPPTKAVTAAPKKAAAKKAAAAGGIVRKRWFKKMSHSDAQQPKTSASNIKGIVTLGNDRGRFPINAANYFRDVFFDNLAWTGIPVPRGVKESAQFDADLIVNGSSIGAYTLTVDHQTSRISGQHNVPTWLHWEDFGQYLRSHNHIDDYVSIERLADGAFRIVIESGPTGPFIDT